MKASSTKKVLALLFAVLLILPVMTGCAKSSGAIELEAKNTIEDNTLAQITEYTNEAIGGLLSKNTYQAFADYRAQGQGIISPAFDNALDKRWADFVAAHGEVVSAEAKESEAHENSYVSHLILTGEDGEMMRLNITFNESGNPYSMTLEPYADDSNMSFGEKMAQAGMNTLVGIIVVFSVLILLSLIISAFKFISAAETKLSKKSEPAPAPVPQTAAAPAEEPADDTQLVAVIAAAIAAAEHMSTDDFVVRSITRLS